MSSNHWLFRVFIIFSLFALLDNCPVFGAGLKSLRGHLLAETQRLAPTGDEPATNLLRLAIGLPLRHTNELDHFLAELSDAGSANFRKYLTPEEFTARFGPTEEDYAAVKNFSLTNGFQIIATHGNRLVLDVAGRAADVQRAFHLRLKKFRHPAEAHEFFAPDLEPAVDAEVPIADVSGLNDFARPHSKAHPAKILAAKGGSGAGGAYVGTDFRSAYVPGTALNGAGQMVGLVQFDGFYSNDIVAYENLLPSQPRVPLLTVLLDNFDGTPTTGPNSGNIEVSLDIEMAIAMAPALSKIVLFEGNSSPGLFFPADVLSQMVASNSVKNLSCSWGWNGVPNATMDSLFKQMAAQGQTFFNASGDSDAFTLGANSVNGADNPSTQNSPSSSPFITQVGGTTLATSGQNYSGESVWNSGGGLGSSGGVSSAYAIPSWQTNISIAANQSSAIKRNIPDVALTGDNILVYYGNGGSDPVVGTSCSAPLWAGFMALVNQQAAANGRAPVGFANPSLYAIARSANYTNCFHDVTTGNNFWSSSPAQYFATNGYDLCTGLGTPNGTNLINALVNLTDILAIFPSGLNFTGSNSGPFAVTSQIFSLTNLGIISFNWRATNIPPWLTLQPANGTVLPGGFTNLTISLNTASSNLIGGNIYHADILFTNLTTGGSQTRPVDLQVFTRSILPNGGFETGDFTGWTLVGDTFIGANLFDAVIDANSLQDGTGSNFIHSGNYGAFLGDTQVATLSQSFVSVPGQRYFISFWLDNPTSGSVQQFFVNWISAATNQIYYRSNPPVLAWTNLTFTVTATATNSTLQFGAENQPNGFGLDDVTVTPIPVPTVTSFNSKTNSFNFSWNTLPGIAYQVQYKTNLLQTNWLTLRSLTSSNYSLTVTDTNVINTSPQRFYRIVEP